jgi:hypothetical protein
MQEGVPGEREAFIGGSSRYNIRSDSPEMTITRFEQEGRNHE